MLAEVRQATRADAAPGAVLDDAVRAIAAALADAGRPRGELAVVGLAIAGEALGLPVALENDANAGALGELRFGAARGLQQVVYLTVSTGIGGGIIIDGRLYRGGQRLRRGVRHMVLDPDGPACGCGNRGCLEALASGSAIAREGRDAAARGESPALARLALSVGRDELTAEHVAEAAAGGDAVAAGIVTRAAGFFGLGLAAIVNALNPEAIIIGGVVSNLGHRFLGPAETAMRERALALPADAVSLRSSALGDRAAALGAVALVSASSGRVS